MSSMNPHTNL